MFSRSMLNIDFHMLPNRLESEQHSFEKVRQRLRLISIFSAHVLRIVTELAGTSRDVCNIA